MGMQEDREENERNREPRDDDATASTKKCDTRYVYWAYSIAIKNVEERVMIVYAIVYIVIFSMNTKISGENMENSGTTTVHRIDVQTVE